MFGARSEVNNIDYILENTQKRLDQAIRLLEAVDDERLCDCDCDEIDQSGDSSAQHQEWCITIKFRKDLSDLIEGKAKW